MADRTRDQGIYVNRERVRIDAHQPDIELVMRTLECARATAVVEIYSRGRMRGSANFISGKGTFTLFESLAPKVQP